MGVKALEESKALAHHLHGGVIDDLVIASAFLQDSIQRCFHGFKISQEIFYAALGTVSVVGKHQISFHRDDTYTLFLFPNSSGKPDSVVSVLPTTQVSASRPRTILFFAGQLSRVLDRWWTVLVALTENKAVVIN